VATLLAAAAMGRTESRGCHRRTDAPGQRPEWQVRLVHRLDAGQLQTRTEPVRALDLAVA
jgi:L-aspartate oxidase